MGYSPRNGEDRCQKGESSGLAAYSWSSVLFCVQGGGTCSAVQEPGFHRPTDPPATWSFLFSEVAWSKPACGKKALERPGDSFYKYKRQPCEQRPFIPSILGGQDLNREKEIAWMDKERFKEHTAGHRLLPLAVSAMHTEKKPCLRGGDVDQTPASLRVQDLSLLISVISLQPHKSTFFFKQTLRDS